jgi:hypothetical protein
MIQRIQTIYLLLALICVALMYAIPFAEISTSANNYIFNHNGLMSGEKNMAGLPYHIVIAILCGITLVTIFLYKKRSLQLKLGRLNFLLHVAFVVILFFDADGAANALMKELPEGEAILIAYKAGFYLPVAAIAFLMLANRSIKKDDELIRSLDRLR